MGVYGLIQNNMLQHGRTTAPHHSSQISMSACETCTPSRKRLIFREVDNLDHKPDWSCGVNYSDVAEGQVRGQDVSNPGPQSLSCVSWTGNK